MIDHPSVVRDSYVVRAAEVEPSGRLSGAALARLLSETAGNGAVKLGFAIEDLMQQGLTWVLARLRVSIDAWPTWKETLAIETWPSSGSGLVATRDFLLEDGAGRRIGEATSLWMVLDVATRRPVRLPASVRATEKPDRPRALDGALDPLGRPRDGAAAGEFAVRYDDIDVNRHANNACYVGWALDCIPPDLRASRELAEFGVDFRAEAHLGDRLRGELELREDEDGAETIGLHRLVRAEDGVELALARTRWRRPR